MPVASPAIVLLAAVALVLVLGRFPERANPITGLAWFARTVSGDSAVSGLAARLAGAALVGVCSLLAVVFVRAIAESLPFMLVIVLPRQAASLVKTVLSALILWCALSLPGGAQCNNRFTMRPSRRLSRDIVTPLLFFTLFGLEAALAWTGAVAAVEALPEHWAAPGKRILALIQYVPARIAALAACVAAPFAGGRRRQAWAGVLAARRPADMWHSEWVSAAMEEAPDRGSRAAVCAVLVVVAGCLTAMALPLAYR